MGGDVMPSMVALPADQGTFVPASSIEQDEEFQNLLPAPSAEEQKQRERALMLEGCREVLVVWPCAGRRILLLGYEFIDLLKQHQLAVRIIEKEFTSRDDARMFIIQEQLPRRNLGMLAVSYLRGLRYQALKRPEGRSVGYRILFPFARGKTAEALAATFEVSAATIRLDAQVTAAVNDIAEVCGGWARPLLLARTTRLSRGRLLALARLPEAKQKEVIFHLRMHGRLPRSWHEGESDTITLPRLALKQANPARFFAEIS
jgi:hypothetical protein